MPADRSSRLRLLRRLSPVALCGVLIVLLAATATAHESRQVGAYTFEVGFLDEPVYVGQRSGLELAVTKGGTPVEGLERTLKAEVKYGPATMALDLVPAAEGAAGYTATFIPTAAGKYTFHLSGTVEGTPVDESFTSSPTGFDEVRESASGQFPVVLPTTAELAADAKRGADAAALVPVALGAGVAGIVVGLLALGIGLAGRRRTRPGA